MSDRISSIIDEYRNKKIIGKCIDLIPFTLDNVENVVSIRNKDRNKYFLNQTYEISVQSQTEWYQRYIERHNDIYWCIYNKEAQFVGTIRIYDIDDENDICDQGSFMIDEEIGTGTPYALEAEILTLDFIFEKLKIARVINEDRADNKVMNNLTKKIGFIFEKKTIINCVDYNYYLLDYDNYKNNREKFQTVIDYWVNR